MRIIPALLALSICLPAVALEATKPSTSEEAAAQRERAQTLREEADRRLATEQAACYSRFLVNACLDDAKKRNTQAKIEARQLDVPAIEFQRETRRAEAEAKEATREAENRKREIEQAEDARRYREAEAQKAADRERRLADKEQEAAAGRQKAEADQADRARREEQYRKQDAERAAQRARRDAEAFGAVSERAKPRQN